MYKVLYDLTQLGWQVKLKQHEGKSILSSPSGARLILHWEMRKYETYNLWKFDSEKMVTVLEMAGFTPAHAEAPTK